MYRFLLMNGKSTDVKIFQIERKDQGYNITATPALDKSFFGQIVELL